MGLILSSSDSKNTPIDTLTGLPGSSFSGGRDDKGPDGAAARPPPERWGGRAGLSCEQVGGGVQHPPPSLSLLLPTVPACKLRPLQDRQGIDFPLSSFPVAAATIHHQCAACKQPREGCRGATLRLCSSPGCALPRGHVTTIPASLVTLPSPLRLCQVPLGLALVKIHVAAVRTHG